jgi:hypothetical protein
MYRIVFGKIELQIIKYHKIILEQVRSKFCKKNLIVVEGMQPVILTKIYKFSYIIFGSENFFLQFQNKKILARVFNRRPALEKKYI